MLGSAILTMGILTAAGIIFIAAHFLRSLAQEYRSDRVPALLYHRLISRRDWESRPIPDSDRSYVVYDTEFAKQMGYLQREGYTTISLDDFSDYLDRKKTLPPKSILITFDDGFASNYHYAFPILKEHGMKATVFMTPDRNSENFKKNIPIDFPLTDAQLGEMSRNGIAVQSHGMTHRYLTELDADTVRWELAESKRVLEKTMGRPVNFLAIPSGAYNSKVKKLVGEAGYQAAFCMLKGTNNRSSDRFALRRLVIGRDLNLQDFANTLRPATAANLRFFSSIQNFLLYLLGPVGLDALRDVLYRSRFGATLARGQLNYLIPGFAVALLVVFFALVMVSRFAK